MKHVKGQLIPEVQEPAQSTSEGVLDSDALERSVRALAIELKCSGEEVANLIKTAFQELGFDCVAGGGSPFSPELSPKWRLLLLQNVQTKLNQRFLDRIDDGAKRILS